MKLRTAIKIMRFIEEPWRSRRRSPNYSRQTVQEAWRICERKWKDRRVPVLPDEQQLEMREELLTQLLLGGPMFGEGILEGLVPPEVLEEARKKCGYSEGATNGEDTEGNQGLCHMDGGAAQRVSSTEGS